MLLIHALRSDGLDVGRIATNEAGYQHLLRLLAGDPDLEPEEGVIYGPYPCQVAAARRRYRSSPLSSRRRLPVRSHRSTWTSQRRDSNMSHN
jgi:hypothetical protein